MPINQKPRVSEIRAKNAAKEREQLRANIRANALPAKPRAGLVREALIKKELIQQLEHFFHKQDLER